MITFSNLTVGYRRKKPVLKNLNGGFSEHSVHGLLGANGVGKTTMLKAVCGLLVPYAGTVAVDNKSSSLRLPSTLRELFFVPEEFGLPPVTLSAYAKMTSPFYPNFSQEVFLDNCREMDVDASTNLDAMSMGQRKKSYIAFALACRTSYLIMDEPTNGLDIPAKSVLKRLLAAQADAGTTIIISTHQVADLEKLVDSVTIMDNNGIILSAATRDLEEKLYFGPVEKNADCLYKEEMLTGLMGVAENTAGVETSVDLTLLFNAAVRNRNRLTEIINRKK